MISTKEYKNEIACFAFSIGLSHDASIYLDVMCYEGPYDPTMSAQQYFVSLYDHEEPDAESANALCVEIVEAAETFGRAAFDAAVREITIRDWYANGYTPTVRTEDGYTFIMRNDGGVSDGDQTYPSLQHLVAAMGPVQFHADKMED